MPGCKNTYSCTTIFPEEVSSRERWLLRVFSHHIALTVGFSFAAAANPHIKALLFYHSIRRNLIQAGLAPSEPSQGWGHDGIVSYEEDGLDHRVGHLV